MAVLHSSSAWWCCKEWLYDLPRASHATSCMPCPICRTQPPQTVAPPSPTATSSQ
jgi:hypothetical protein